MSEEKICPLNLRPCLRDTCALWLEIQKQAANPYWKFVYQGCGLIQHIPWQPEKKPETKGQP